MSMTPAARKLLATTVRALRARLLGAPDGLAPPAAHALLHRLVVLHMLAARATAGPDDVAELARRALAPDADPEHAALGRASAALAVELPGLFGPPATRDVPPAVLRHAIAALAHPDLTPCWTDDLTPGWAHQSWNDPEREALDARLHARARLEPHEIASKTQLFSERYLVDWLLHNSLGPLWLAICARNGWTAEVVADGTLARLEARRAAWRARRARGEVDPGEPLPLHGDAEPLWAHYMPQPLAADAVEHAPASVRDVALLDPAVGAGHVLIAAFDLLLALHREEARHRGEVGRGAWTDRRIVEHIVEHNLHGVDIDARPVQIAAAALWLRARRACPEARPRRMNLVASDLRLGPDAPGHDLLRGALLRDLGLPRARVDRLLTTLAAAEHLGSLLRVERALADAGGPGPLALRGALERHFRDHGRGDDLGLGLDGEPAGARYLRIAREDRYDLVIGNPPYQATSRLRDAEYVKATYPRGKADLYAAFLERGLQLARPGGTSALLTMRGWMFARQYTDLRTWLLQTHDLRALGDFAVGAFEDVPNDLLSVAAGVFRRAPPDPAPGLALLPTPPDDRSYDRARTQRKRAAVLAQVGRRAFTAGALAAVPGWPLAHWWGDEVLQAYRDRPRVGDVAPGKKGLCTNDDERFLRKAHEVRRAAIAAARADEDVPRGPPWAPAIRGGKGRRWFEPLVDVIRWACAGLELHAWIEAYRARSPGQYTRNPDCYFRPGVAFSTIGVGFDARAHRYRSVFGNMGSSLFPDDVPATLCALNSARARDVLQGLNPGVHFEVGDVNRLPLFPVADADRIVATLERAFAEHESHRETSVEYRRPGPSPWRHAQAWAQAAVDRPAGAPLPDYAPQPDREPPVDHLAFALGVALGRFDPGGRGILDPQRDDLAHALPAGILLLDGTLAPDDLRDGLGHPAARPLLRAWSEHGPALARGGSLRTWLAREFFALHRRAHDNRPIHWPLASQRRTFVAWVTIHRMTAATLPALLADHLHPALARIDRALARHRAAEQDDLTGPRAAAEHGDLAGPRAADRRRAVGAAARLTAAREELLAFIAATRQCAEAGPPPLDPRRPERERDAGFDPDLDDGVTLNAAALWPLLPQWPDPRRWWQELVAAAPGKDRDWSRLAMRHWPTRVDARCRQDPSLAAAHGCLYRYHPAWAWAWELRLQDEHGPRARVDEPAYRGDGGSAAHRAAYLRERPDDALARVEREALRRLRRRGPAAELRLPAPGLWTAAPDRCRALEARVAARQGGGFRLRAPDEPTGPGDAGVE